MRNMAGVLVRWVLALWALGAAGALKGRRTNNDDIRLSTLMGDITLPRNGIRRIGDLRQRLERKYKSRVDLLQNGKLMNDAEHIENVAKEKINVMVPLRGGMRVQVQTMMGQKLEVDVEPNETVLDLKKKLSKKQKLPVDQQRIIFEGKMLQDNKTLAEYNIKNNSVIHMVLRLRGGSA
ncbi:ubiquitin family protein [Babesia caballi]|uniref:Ubiquitin family protein n=1 Tax=Babesia caballi TaxID=5871 RepID=A0AAV4LV03_BABCB|nr:ubiquitin family protein [Babesia caballi]